MKLDCRQESVKIRLVKRKMERGIENWADRTVGYMALMGPCCASTSWSSLTRSRSNVRKPELVQYTSQAFYWHAHSSGPTVTSCEMRQVSCWIGHSLSSPIYSSFLPGYPDMFQVLFRPHDRYRHIRRLGYKNLQDRFFVVTHPETAQDELGQD